LTNAHDDQQLLNFCVAHLKTENKSCHWERSMTLNDSTRYFCLSIRFFLSVATVSAPLTPLVSIRKLLEQFLQPRLGLIKTRPIRTSRQSETQRHKFQSRTFK
jgi:hypothetical protein